MRNRKFPLGRSQPLVNFCGFHRQLRPAGIRERHVFNGHPHHAPRDVAGIATAVQHPHKPVKGRIGVTAPNAFVHRADLVVKVVAPLIKAAHRGGQGLTKKFFVHRRHVSVFCHPAGDVERIQKPPGIAVGQPDQEFPRFFVHGHAGNFPRERPIYEFVQFVMRQTFQHING